MTTASTYLTRATPQAAAGTRYRADIDGLRAIAVLPVVFYHYGVWPFSGGYVGVDVFFVISGYLITSLIHTEMEERRFSVIDFYDRRIRRIFPALFAMLAVTTLAALVALFPDALVRFSETLPATAGFASNFEFVHKAGYFDVAASQKPLLHTWSLAVEEQFYLFFPGLLYLLRGANRERLLAVLGAILVMSLAANIWGVRYNPVSTFFLLPFRFWELLMGSILAVGRFPAPASALARNAISAFGVVLIATSIFVFTAATPYPGENALLPCLGTALVIYAGSGARTAVNSALATPMLVAIGLMSYSLYLWHWPVYVIAKAYAFGALAPRETVLLIALSFVLAFVSWRFVELPFRGRHGALSRRALFAIAGGAIIATASIGELLRIGDGFPQRYNANVRTILAETNDGEHRSNECEKLSLKNAEAGHLCAIGRANVQPSFLVWGDSHAGTMLPAIDAASIEKGRAGLFAVDSSCAPLLHVPRPDARDCEAVNDAVLKIALRREIRLVLLDARWATYTDPTPYGPNGLQVILTDTLSKDTTAAEMSEIFARGLERTVRSLVAAGKKVVIVASVPESKWSVPQALARAAIAGQQVRLGSTIAEFRARQKFAFALFDALRTKYGVEIVYPDRILCATGTCMVAHHGIPLYCDDNHLSLHGARLLVTLFAPVL
ncbi:MAG: acyltransferase family protein [Rhizomicrobium sp.]